MREARTLDASQLQHLLHNVVVLSKLYPSSSHLLYSFLILRQRSLIGFTTASLSLNPEVWPLQKRILFNTLTCAFNIVHPATVRSSYLEMGIRVNFWWFLQVSHTREVVSLRNSLSCVNSAVNMTCVQPAMQKFSLPVQMTSLYPSNKDNSDTVIQQDKKSANPRERP